MPVFESGKVDYVKIRTRFNLVLLVVFLPGFAISVLVTYKLLIDNAKAEVLRNAGLMMETALAVRSYTIDQIKPHLDPMLEAEFLPQTVPAFAATETFSRLRKSHPDYSYKEATLNPTNPRDKVTDWERSEVVERFRTESVKELVGEREDAEGKSYLYIARPIQITNPACLACHDKPAMAPLSLTDRYGTQNGFNWKLNDIVGAQIVTVPTDVPLQNARHAVLVVSLLLLGLIVALFLALNLVLDRLVIKPIQHVSQISDQISLGNFDIPEFREDGAEEIRQLRASFNRMRRSIEKAMRMLKAKGNVAG